MMGPSGKRMQRTASITAAWMGPKFNAGAEYFRQDNASHDRRTQLLRHQHLHKGAAGRKSEVLFARYDRIASVTMDGAEDPWNLSRDGSYIYAGIDFSPVKNVRISPNYNSYIQVLN